MRIRTFIAVALTLFAIPLFASDTKIYAGYETARQALLSESMPDVTKSAAAIAAAARVEKQGAIAERAADLSKARDLPAARSAFAALSEELIKLRAKGSGDRPVVVYCSMEKKSWLQPKGAISNPYVAKRMRGCGEITAQ